MLFVAVGLAIVFGFEAVATIFVKRWVVISGPLNLALGVLLYGASVVTWAYVLRHIELYKAVLYYAIGSAILYLLIGYFGYNESVSLRQGAGAVLGLAALVLLSI